MKDEAEFKSCFKKSVRAQGGYSLSISAPMLAGLPDLYCIMPGFMPVLLEAKWHKEVGHRFCQKIEYTALQRQYLEECCKVHLYAGMGLIGFKRNGIFQAVLMDIVETHITDDFPTRPFTYRGDNKLFDVAYMFHMSKIPRIGATVADNLKY